MATADTESSEPLPDLAPPCVFAPHDGAKCGQNIRNVVECRSDISGHLSYLKVSDVGGLNEYSLILSRAAGMKLNLCMCVMHIEQRWVFGGTESTRHVDTLRT